MNLEDRLDADLKTAMLAGRSEEVGVLRGLKSVILNAKIAAGTRNQPMPDEEIQHLFGREAKKRQESADLYRQGGNEAKAAAELREKAQIESYLPAQLSENELTALIEVVVGELQATGPAQMGQVIGEVKKRAGAAADGAVIAGLVKKRLS